MSESMDLGVHLKALLTKEASFMSGTSSPLQVATSTLGNRRYVLWQK